IEIRRLETLEENHIGMLATGRSGATWVPRRRHALCAIDAIIAKVRAKVREVCLKRVEKRKRFRGLDMIEVTAKANGVPVEAARDVVDHLEARLAIKIRVAAVH